MIQNHRYWKNSTSIFRICKQRFVDIDTLVLQGYWLTLSQTLTVLNPFANIDQHIMDDSDLAGPLLLYFLLGIFTSIAGNSYFGYIYGLAILGSGALHSILALMSPPVTPNDASSMSAQDGGSGAGSRHFSSNLTLTRSASVLGYCLLPLVFVSLLGIVVSMNGLLGYAITSVAIAWCTYSSSGMFCAVGRMQSMRGKPQLS